MKKELLASEKKAERLELDPRTKLALLITIAIFVLGQTASKSLGLYAVVLAIVPIVLMLISGKVKNALIFFLIYVCCMLATIFLVPDLSGVLQYIVIALCSLFMRFLPGIAMGYYTVTSTTVSEFIAAMEKMHITEKITIPMSVIFRFFPTIFEECSAINDAMKMRGISMKNAGALALVEYRLVPMLMCSVKIGEELSVASLTRGLGGPVKRTNICSIGFRAADFVLLAVCAAAFVLCAVGAIK